MPLPTATELSEPEVVRRSSLATRVVATIIWAGAIYFAVEANLSGELTLKLAAGGIAAVVGTGIFLGTWFDAYIFDSCGVKHRRFPLWFTRSEPYVLRWDRPVYAFTRDHGFFGSELTLTNHDADSSGVSVLNGSPVSTSLLREVRRNHAAFALDRFEEAEEFLVDGANKVG